MPTVIELRKSLKELKLSTSGTKKQLEKRLEKARQEEKAKQEEVPLPLRDELPKQEVKTKKQLVDESQYISKTEFEKYKIQMNNNVIQLMEGYKTIIREIKAFKTWKSMDLTALTVPSDSH